MAEQHEAHDLSNCGGSTFGPVRSIVGRVRAEGTAVACTNAARISLVLLICLVAGACQKPVWPNVPTSAPGSSPAGLKVAILASDEPVGTGQDLDLRGLSSGNPTSWNWDLGDGTTREGQNLKKSWNRPGNYTVRLIVAEGATAVVAEQVITVVARSADEFGYTATDGTPDVGQLVTFSSWATDPNATVSWNFGDGSTAQGRQVTHTFTRPGMYSVAMTVLLADGTSADAAGPFTIG